MRQGRRGRTVTASAWPVPVSAAAEKAPSVAVVTVDYLAIQQSDAFVELRRRRRRLALTGCVAFVVPYLAFVLASVLAPQVLGTPVLGSVNAGFLLGFAVIAWTLVLIRWYRTRSARDVDPLVAALRLQWEGSR